MLKIWIDPFQIKTLIVYVQRQQDMSRKLSDIKMPTNLQGDIIMTIKHVEKKIDSKSKKFPAKNYD